MSKQKRYVSEFGPGFAPAQAGVAAASVPSVLPDPSIPALHVGGVRCARFKYSFATDGGAQTEIIPLNAPTLPANAIVIGGMLIVITAPTGTGATVAVGTHAGSAADSILAATAITALTQHTVVELIGRNSAAATNKVPFRMTAAGQLSITVGTAALTAGVIEFLIEYVPATGS